ncbi:MAG: DUF3160 domain-containing protein [Caldilineaceae bacterium]
MSKTLNFVLIGALLLSTGLVACGGAQAPQSPLAPPSPDPLPAEAVQPLAHPDFGADAARPYWAQVTYTPQTTKYFDLVNQTLPFDQEELNLLSRQGFVVSERWTWQRFVEAYAWIYWKDLPVLVTTDSLLHTVHQSYDDLLQDLELALLIPQLRTILAQTVQQVQTQRQANQLPDLEPIYADVEAYIRTATTLLAGGSGDQTTAQFIDRAVAADSLMDVSLFGSARTVDFTLFRPRGHYAGIADLENYFRAMSWLAQIDFRLVEFDMLTSEPIINPTQIAAAVILHNALDAAGQRASWDAFNALFEVLVGRSDNMTLPDLDRFLADMALTDPAAVLATPTDQLLTQLLTHDYGQQRITGQIFYRSLDNHSPDAIPRPVSFLFMGQRFAIDSYVTGNVVFDRVMANGEPVMRALPSPLDIMYALGNDRAATHLTEELARYPYGGYLAALRQQIDGVDESFWQAPIYNEWLGLIRTLNVPTVDAAYPQSMRTAAWSDKTLETQLAAWTQLRHDNILYVKQSFTTAGVVCEYPAGYVEPYPVFYQALRAFADRSSAALSGLAATSDNDYATYVRERALTYFQAVSSVATQLATLAAKELRLEEFTPEEELFLRSIVVLKEDLQIAGCGGPTFEDQWNGWYMALFYRGDDNPALIADVHTNPTTDPNHPLYPPRVLHAATGALAPIFFIVDTDESTMLYVGPTFTYYELTTTGDASHPAARMTDEEWRTQLQAGNAPPAPSWTQSFRLTGSGQPETLRLPTNFPPEQRPRGLISPLPTPTK